MGSPKGQGGKVKNRERLSLCLGLGALTLLACAGAGGLLGLTPTPPPPTAPHATLTLTPAATSTPAPTRTPTDSPTATPTLNPLTIESMRRRQYPGSDIIIEQELTPGANYRRYIASYRSEGLKIYALLTIPDGDPPPTGWPVIIFNHGYIPPEQYRTTERYVAYVDSLARSGYIVLKSDYRGHGDSEGLARGAYGYPDYVIDVLNAVSSMKAFPQADPNRIGMWGHSMGGYITLRAMVIRDDIKAGVIWSGVVGSYADMLCCWHRSPSASAPTPAPGRGWRGSLSDIYGSPEENPAFWDSISANSYLADLSGPLQLHHGTADTEVPLEFTQKLYEEVQAAGKTVEFYEYPGADHNLSQPFSLAMQRTIAFFNRYLKGE
jgi:dipeptidyl aminopeptidase/acylaminoacyl peptidase